MSHERVWHYYDHGQVRGPVSDDELVQLLAAGEVVPDTLIWDSSVSQWLPAKEIFGAPTAHGESADPRVSEPGHVIVPQPASDRSSRRPMTTTSKIMLAALIGTSLLGLLAAIGVVLVLIAPRSESTKLQEHSEAIPSLDLQNRLYVIADRPVQLHAGKYDDDSDDNPLHVALDGFSASAQLLPDGPAVTVNTVSVNGGGSGHTTYLFAIDSHSGVSLASRDLGELTVEALTIADNAIHVSDVEAAPNDAHCCPTLHKTRTFRLTGSGLEEVDSGRDAEGTPQPAAPGVRTRTEKRSSSEPAPPPQEEYAPGTLEITGERAFGCLDRKYFQKVWHFLNQRDLNAYAQALAAGQLEGQCIPFNKGQIVYLDELGGLFSDAIQVHRKGDTVEYWTYSGWANKP